MTAAKQKIFVFGARGHAKVVIDAIECQGEFEIAIVADDDVELTGSEILSYRVVGTRNALVSTAKLMGVTTGIVAIGSNSARETVAGWLSNAGFGFVPVVHPAATVARTAHVGAGTVLMAGAVVNAGSRIGEHVVVNTGATVDHDCTIGDLVHVAPGAHVCGNVRVGRKSFVCAGATIIPNIEVGSAVTIGAGSTVLGDVSDGDTVVGSPARVTRRE